MAVADTLTGGIAGGIGGVLTKSSQKNLANLTQHKDNPNIANTNEAVAVEAELRGDQNNKAIKNAKTPEDIEKLKNQVTPEDVHLGKVYNDGKDAYYPWMKPTIAGARIPYDNIMLTSGWRKVLSNENNVWYFNQGRILQGLRSDIIDSIKSFGLPRQMIDNMAGYDLKASRKFDYETSPLGHIKARTIKTIQDFLPDVWTNVPAKFYDAFMYGENLYGEPLNVADVIWQ